MSRMYMEGEGIRSIAKRFSLTERTLRFYEDQGLICPKRRGQNRIYTEETLKRIDKIIRYRHSGLRLSDIKVLLDLSEQQLDKSHTSDPRETAQKWSDCQKHVKILKRRKQEITYTLEDLNIFLSYLETSLQSASKSDWLEDNAKAYERAMETQLGDSF